MRILILSPHLPFPADNGGKLRMSYMATYLARHHEVAFVSFAEDPERALRSPELAERFSDVRLVPFPQSKSQLRRWLSPVPGGLREYNSAEMAGCVDTVITRFSPEVLLVNDPLLTRYVAAYADRVRILDYICVDTLQFERLQRLSSGPSQLLWRLRQLKFTAYLRRIARCYDLCVVNSAEDRAALLAASPSWKHVEFLPNGLDLTLYPRELATPQPNTLVFPGALTYPPNLDAATYFVRDILPRIRAHLPDVKLMITGQVPTDGSAPEGPEIIYTGYVPDVRPVIAGAWVCPVPLRAGAGGARFKVLEALALGTPVVSTAIGAEGAQQAALFVDAEHLGVHSAEL